MVLKALRKQRRALSSVPTVTGGLSAGLTAAISAAAAAAAAAAAVHCSTDALGVSRQ